jgi:hypothetical protein
MQNVSFADKIGKAHQILNGGDWFFFSLKSGLLMTGDTCNCLQPSPEALMTPCWCPTGKMLFPKCIVFSPNVLSFCPQ